MKLIYFANIRVPSEKAHVLQIMQMCEAFARAGSEVTLVAARRLNTPEMARIQNPWDYYGVEQCFALRRLACLDLFPWRWLNVKTITFLIQSITYTVSVVIYSMFTRADAYYTRDIPTVVALSFLKPRRAIVWEVHQFSRTRLGILLQRYCARRAGLVVALTARLKEQLGSCGAPRSTLAPDGFRQERFSDLPTKGEARARSRLPKGLFLVGYAGRLVTMSMSKGVERVVEAIAAMRNYPVGLCLVGGPDEMETGLRGLWSDLGLPLERFFFAGQVCPESVPVFLAAFDVCVLPFPWTEHFAYHASPLKLFEYMASGKPIVSSDLPAISEIVRHEESALLVPAEDVEALSEAIRRLYEDPALRSRLGEAARLESAKYSWAVRARNILTEME